MKVIGAGFGRTGTVSLQAALEQLGYPCYHMYNLTKNPQHVRAWHDFAVGRAPMDWEALFRGYDATVDFPTCLFYEELLQAFPGAVVILSVRDPERWFRSFASMWRVKERWRPVTFTRRMRMIHEFLDKLLLEPVFDGRVEEQRCLEAFVRHIERVKAAVPADRLLVYEIKQGWEPLCAFLGREVPKTSFPHLNEGNSTIVREYAKRFIEDVVPGWRARTRPARDPADQHRTTPG